MSILTSITAQAGIVLTDLEVPDLEPDFSPAPIQAGLQLANQVLAAGTVIGVVAMIAIGCLLMFAGLGSHNKSKAWVALGIAAVACAFMGSISGAMTFFGNIPLF